MLRRTRTLLVCLILVIPSLAPASFAWNPNQVCLQGLPETVVTPFSPVYRADSPGESREIFKCRPFAGAHLAARGQGGHSNTGRTAHESECSLPEHRNKGWGLAADAFFARTKGKVRFSTGMSFGFANTQDVDLNTDMGLDDHGVMGSYMAMHTFKPRWALWYSVMPMTMMGSGEAGKSFVFGNTQYTAGQAVSVQWERLEQRMGLMFDAVHAHSSRISLFAGYVRITDRIRMMQMQAGMGGGVMDNDLNMAMVGCEFERCLKSTRNEAILSLECKASASFLDDAVGGEAETAFKYSIPMSNGRRGFVKGGYRYLTYKKKSSDVRLFDIAMEGGFLQGGLVF